MSVKLSDAQWAAVKAIVAWYIDPYSPQVFYLAGYAGTGKSTIFRAVIEELRKHGLKKHALATFTGKAASVLRKKGNPEATTLHALIYIIQEEDEPSVDETAAGFEAAPKMKRPPGDLPFVVNTFGPATEVDLIALDECGMVDGVQGKDVLSFGKKVLVMGDPGQLPPVRGTGFFTAMEPDVMLTEVHRQALESPILRLATRARMGEQIPFGEVMTEHAGSARVLPLNKRNEHLVYREETQPICGVHRVRRTVTGRIRHARGFGGTLPMAGERLMCGKNSKELGLFNGMQGTLLSQPAHYKRKDGDDESFSRLLHLDVHMDDDRLAHEKLLVDPWMFEWHQDDRVEQPKMKKTIQWFDYGYVVTCHKAQGSEWPDVTIVDDAGSFGDDRHRWRYTAITRASENLTILRR